MTALLFDTFASRVRLKGTLTAVTAFRIGAGRSLEVAGSDLPVVRDALGRPYLPGSSLKGALRAYTESLLRALPHGRACNPLDQHKEEARENPALRCVSMAEMQSWQRDQKLGDAAFSERVYRRSCHACRTFGSHFLASKVSIRDFQVDETFWFGQFEVRNGVALDRGTETASDGKLYDFEVVPAGTPFGGEVVVENAEPWQLGLLLAGLRPFELGEAQIGGARSRGLGEVKLEWSECTRIDGDNLLDWITGAAPTPLTKSDFQGWLGEFRRQISQPEVQHA